MANIYVQVWLLGLFLLCTRVQSDAHLCLCAVLACLRYTILAHGRRGHSVSETRCSGRRSDIDGSTSATDASISAFGRQLVLLSDIQVWREEQD